MSKAIIPSLSCPHCGHQIVGLDRKFKDLARKLKVYRAMNSFTQDDVAKKIGCSRNTVLRWERGRHHPNRIATQFLQKEGIL